MEWNRTSRVSNRRTYPSACRIICLVGLAGVLYGCRVTVPGGSLEPDFYQIFHTEQAELSRQKVYITDAGDSLQIVIPDKDQRRLVRSPAYRQWTFRRAEVDVDVFTLPFKIRPSQANVPAQLNANFNAALYLGRRIDLYDFNYQPITPTFNVRRLRSRGFGYGIFAGVGSVAINNFVTRSPVGVEYEGVVLDAGFATIYDARVFNVGFAVGADYLMDPNRREWIYQQKPWFGVLFGLNLN